MSALSRVSLSFLSSASLVAAIAIATPASWANYAGNSGSQGCTGVNESQPSTYGSFLYIDLEDYSENQTDWVRAERLNVLPGINTYRVSSESLFTSVLVRDQHYVDYCGKDWWQNPAGGGTVGMASCDQVEPSLQCSKHTVRYNLNWTYHPNRTLGERRGLACHENGHALGLTHSTFDDDDSCMPQQYPKPRNGYSPHDGAHITANYT
jgi:hypothetical protein